MYFIGIDLGTSSLKSLLVNEKGVVINSITKEYPIYFPKTNYSEQDPNDWYKACIDGIEELIKDINKEDIVSISFAGQMHGLVALDKNNQIIRNAILWNDNRSYKEVDYLNNVIGKKTLSDNTANIAYSGFTLPKIMWMKENEPLLFSKIKKIMLPKDYLSYRLSGVFATDYSDASGTLLLDVKNKRWNLKMLKLAGLTIEQLPKIYESYDCIGYLNDELRNYFGIKRDVRIIIGAGDNACAAISTGAINDGDMNLSLGTSGTLFISSNRFKADDNNALHAFCHANGKYHLMGCMLTAASCNAWWMNQILQTKDYDNEQKLIKELGHNNVYFLPYLMGERSPHNDPFAKGTFIGMNMDTKREDMTLAIYEGVAFALRDSLEVAKKQGLNISFSTICGGGSKSAIWRNIIANVMNIELRILENEEGPSFGACILGMVGSGLYNNVYDACEATIKIKNKELPDPNLVKLYEEKYNRFKQLYPIIKDAYKII